MVRRREFWRRLRNWRWPRRRYCLANCAGLRRHCRPNCRRLRCLTLFIGKRCRPSLVIRLAAIRCILSALPGLETDWVLRHYYRGGLIGKLNRDWFAPVPVATSRGLAEFRLLLWMRQAGLPVPAPVAARYQQRGFGYSADILLERIPHSQDLFHYLQHQALNATQWQQLGALVAQLHQAGGLSLRFKRPQHSAGCRRPVLAD
ncbi:MAG: lipopolysaccharide kinase InaA family protein [Rheinheimera sp.]|nr:lipopolysaccharide kinase InaA family protein [Rheinheimera sp.]